MNCHRVLTNIRNHIGSSLPASFTTSIPITSKSTTRTSLATNLKQVFSKSLTGLMCQVMVTQKSLVLTEKGKPTAFTTLPIPTLTSTELLIKTTVCCVTIIDQRIRDIDRFDFYPKLSAVVGSDLVGGVIANEHNEKFPIGSHVFSQYTCSLPIGGGLQEYTLVHPVYAALVAEGVTDEAAASWPINAVTVGIAIFSKGEFGWRFPRTKEEEDGRLEGEKLVILGGGTTVGKMALQLQDWLLCGLSLLLLLLPTEKS
jgi:NADPH:quinone reductase-like Zn-dependent oxidoreductase